MPTRVSLSARMIWDQGTEVQLLPLFETWRETGLVEQFFAGDPLNA